MIVLQIPDEDERRIKNPADEEIIHAVNAVTWGDLLNGCIDILDTTYDTCLQVVGRQDGLFDIEFHEHKADAHWISDKPLQRAVSLDIALRYSHKDEGWRLLTSLIEHDVSERRQAVKGNLISDILKAILTWATRPRD